MRHPDRPSEKDNELRRAARAAPRAEAGPTTEDLLDRLQHQIGSILESTLNERVSSESPHQLTGGSYQTVRLGARVREGFRATRPNLLSGFALEGRSVCDLGANLGEIARDLRRAGAAHVDAYEYDPLFTQLARYITAYNGMSDINHFEADVAEEGFLRMSYEICVGLSAYSFMGTNIDYICRKVSEQIIIETHEIRDATWPRQYVEPITKHFPHWWCFGRVAHGSASSTKHRLWLAFSKKRPAHLRRAAAIQPDAEGVISVDLQRSSLNDGADMIYALDDPLSTSSLHLYSDRLDEYERQFEAGEAINLSMSGEAYWLALLCGLVQFTEAGGLGEDNHHLRWLIRSIVAGQVAQGLRPLLDDQRLLHNKVSGRMAVLGEALRTRNVSHFPDLPIAFNATPFHPALDGYLRTLALHDSDDRLSVSNLDGHHRLFMMRVLKIERCPMMTIWDLAWLERAHTRERVRNYEQRIYQYLAGVSVDDPVVVKG